MENIDLLEELWASNLIGTKSTLAEVHAIGDDAELIDVQSLVSFQEEVKQGYRCNGCGKEISELCCDSVL
jgi:hypothetical protein